MMEDLTKYAVEISNYFSYNSVVILSYFFICLIMLILNAISKNKINNFLVIRRGSIFNPMNYTFIAKKMITWKNFIWAFCFTKTYGTR